MSDAELRIVGNCVRDVELRFLPSGKAVCDFTVVINHRYQQNGQWIREEPGLFVDCVCFGDMAENVAASVEKQDRVIVHGRLKPEEFEGKNGPVRRMKLMVDDVGLSLRWNRGHLERRDRTKTTEPTYGDESAL